MSNIRKRTMRCERQSACDLCLADCKRAELIAKENGIRADLLAACKELLQMTGMGYAYEDDPERVNRAEAAIAKAGE